MTAANLGHLKVYDLLPPCSKDMELRERHILRYS